MRSDTPVRLTAQGWAALRAYGIMTIFMALLLGFVGCGRWKLSPFKDKAAA